LFDAFWPKDMRRAKQAAEQPGSAAEPAPSVGPNGSAPAPQPPDYQQVSILKSGVVDGMAYTLYSDGSIEAQLPQGTMRFGSITDLRNHLERNA
jgi:hypothetical protein